MERNIGVESDLKISECTGCVSILSILLSLHVSYFLQGPFLKWGNIKQNPKELQFFLGKSSLRLRGCFVLVKQAAVFTYTHLAIVQLLSNIYC